VVIRAPQVRSYVPGMSETDAYEIRVQGHLDGRWSAWFDGMTLVANDDGSTLISGEVADQAALHGLIQRVRDLGLPLLSVTHTPTGPTP
jgi:hypothetical protein